MRIQNICYCQQEICGFEISCLSGGLRKKLRVTKCVSNFIFLISPVSICPEILHLINLYFLNFLSSLLSLFSSHLPVFYPFVPICPCAPSPPTSIPTFLPYFSPSHPSPPLSQSFTSQPSISSRNGPYQILI